MTPRVETIFQSAVDTGQIPGAILCAADSTSTFTYQKTFGLDSPSPDARPFTPDLLLWTASCTKFLTSIAFLKATDLHLIALDDPVDTVLPELSSPQLISRGEDGGLAFAPAKNTLRFRHLLTHTAGLNYGFLDPLIGEWTAQNLPPEPQRRAVVDKFARPLRFEPGTSWTYGCGLDWAGLAVERVAGMSLDAFLRRYVCDPIGVVEGGITFFPQRVKRRRAKVAERDTTTGGFKPVSAGGMDFSRQCDEEYCWGGHSAFAQAPEYLKILKSLLVDDGKILKSETVAELFRPQLSAEAKVKIKEQVFANVFAERAMARSMKKEDDVDFCLGGILDGTGKNGWRGKGTMMWGGAANLVWFVDREKDLCGFLGMQILPMTDEFCTQLAEDFEVGMYELAGKTS